MFGCKTCLIDMEKFTWKLIASEKLIFPSSEDWLIDSINNTRKWFYSIFSFVIRYYFLILKKQPFLCYLFRFLFSSSLTSVYCNVLKLQMLKKDKITQINLIRIISKYVILSKYSAFLRFIVINNWKLFLFLHHFTLPFQLYLYDCVTFFLFEKINLIVQSNNTFFTDGIQRHCSWNIL